MTTTNSTVGWNTIQLRSTQLLLSAFVILVVATNTATAVSVYWTDTLNVVADNIQRATLGGSGPEVVVDDLGNPQDLALDLVYGKVYWTDDLNDKVQRANLDGSNVEDLVTGVNGPKGIDLDVAGNKMYWADNFTDQILRANLDGTDVQVLFAYASGDHFLVGLALDVAAGMVYWADRSPGGDGIYRQDMNGLTGPQLVLSPIGSHGPRWIDVDTVTGDIYWSSDTNRVFRNNQLIASGINNVEGVVVDEVNRLVYWASLSDDKIVRAELDGSNPEDVLTGLGNPVGITLDLTPQTVVPEPSTLILSIIGLLVVLGRTWKRRQCWLQAMFLGRS